MNVRGKFNDTLDIISAIVWLPRSPLRRLIALRIFVNDFGLPNLWARVSSVHKVIQPGNAYLECRRASTGTQNSHRGSIADKSVLSPISKKNEHTMIRSA